MSKFSSQITTLFIVVALVCAFVPVFSVEEAEAKSLWNTCLVKITPKCALDIIAVVFENGTISDPCCNDLVKEGKVCHDTLIKYIADKPMLIAHETEYLKKSDDLWNHCVSISKSA
ncbi:Prolamin-like domain [Arabidopsis thaliana x Arabidopsis arenosa]|uniref:Prolamin-like domain n=2 Tax=Arabidopsis TaxID=3701 RepID=A0A8T1XEV4_9BRAS|nr:Prolamin-like domain [Arabidopsis thaliana x Arabidopsis arenosa]KAG7536690.1 Prolamin-like domain [Arabidopsis suecica]KAG7532999.1 Prolamin-like domain [Arabidopsis thaliana x Arabidopsis arenosa]KAG7536691.1 Prolamin-like domain [Arabidopsis suecica]KAG7536692.1 Prolamin-like domain [Arabidopsis suecica]